MVKNLPGKQEMQVRSLSWEDPLEEEMVTHSSILSGRIPWTEEPGGLQSMQLQTVRHDLAIREQQRWKEGNEGKSYFAIALRQAEEEENMSRHFYTTIRTAKIQTTDATKCW